MVLKCIGLPILVAYIGISNVLAGSWGEWRPISTCSAKPCNCTGYKPQEKCLKGDITEIRSCTVGEDGWTCQYDKKNEGAIRMRKCTNLHVCPGWSDWKEEGPCICDKSTEANTTTGMMNTTTGMIRIVKICNNPPPIHPHVVCINPETGEHTGEMVSERPCNCTGEEDTTEKVEEVSTTLLPCCEITTPNPNDNSNNTDYSDYDNINSNSTNDPNNSEHNALDLPSDDDETTEKSDPSWDYYEDIQNSTLVEQKNCVPCPIVTENVTQLPDFNATTEGG